VNMTVFMLAALVAVLVALAFVLAPLLRSSPQARRLRRRARALEDLADELEPDDYRARRERIDSELARENGGPGAGPGLIIGLVLIVPLATWLMYQVVGEPEGIQDGQSQIEQIRAGLSSLAWQLERNPDDVDNWVRLGMIYKDLQEYSSAEHAFRRALFLDNENPFIQVELAETLLYASQGARLPDAAVALLEQAVEIDPQSQKGLWLLGIGAFQAEQYEQALAWWQQLDNLLPPGSVQNSVREQIQRARSRLSQSPGQDAEPGHGLPPGHPRVTSPGEDAHPSFLVAVDIDETMTDGLNGDETVFLIARAADGPSAPLAVHRFAVRDLPLTLSLSDQDAMLEGLNLSSFPDIILTARVALGGSAEAQAGDLEGRAGPLSILDAPDAQVTIDRRL
jgi:cytochrome c-type biogenesis protein CcmH